MNVISIGLKEPISEKSELTLMFGIIVERILMTFTDDSVRQCLELALKRSKET